MEGEEEGEEAVRPGWLRSEGESVVVGGWVGACGV